MTVVGYTTTLGAKTSLGAIASLVALGVLMIGQFTPDARLTISGVPLNSIFFAIAILLGLLVPLSVDVRHAIILVFSLVAPVCATLIWSRDPERGALTLVNLLAVSAAAALLLAYAISGIGLTRTLKLWVVASVLLLAAAVLYKVERGFLDRNVNFLFNGPNVFARQMGLAAILAGFVYQGPRRYLLVFLFTAAFVWTQSKGPLIALILIGAWSIWQGSGWRGRALLIAMATLAATMIALGIAFLANSPLLGRMFLAVSVFDSGLTAQNFGSIGSRVLMIRETLTMIATQPYGVGIGGWAASSGIAWADYPHNIFLELWSEAGVVLGSIALLAFACFVSSRTMVLVAACWFLLICQQVSGGLLDARFLLALACVAFIGRRGFAPAITRVARS